MTKQGFLADLREGLCGLPKSDLEERLTFYSEMIDDRMEEGLTEEEAVAAIGAVSDIVLQVVDDYPFPEIIKTRIRTRKPMSVWNVVLLTLGSPVWLSLLIAAFAVVLALYVSLWAVILSIWSVFVALVGCALGCLLVGIVFACTGYLSSGLATIAAGLVFSGLSVFAFFGCKAATKGTLWLTKRLLLSVKKCLIRKEGVQ